MGSRDVGHDGEENIEAVRRGGGVGGANDEGGKEGEEYLCLA